MIYAQKINDLHTKSQLFTHKKSIIYAQKINDLRPKINDPNPKRQKAPKSLEIWPITNRKVKLEGWVANRNKYI